MDQPQIYPDLFKVFLPEVSSEIMLIPAAFMKCLDKKLPGKIILRNRVGSLWEVKVVYTRNDGVFFSDGWENFIKDNSLVIGNFLVFRYDGDCIFHVIIYEKRGCEKEDARASLSIGKRLSNVEEEEEEQDCKDDGNSNSSDSGLKEDYEEEEKPKPRANRKMVGGSAKPCGRGRKKKDVEEQPAQVTERAMNAPRMHMPANPSFTVILKSYHVAKNYMLVPADFARICQLHETKIIKLRVSSRKEWGVRCICTDGKARISKGWAAFIWGNDLKEGDVCVFELIQATDTVLKVTVAHC